MADCCLNHFVERVYFKSLESVWTPRLASRILMNMAELITRCFDSSKESSF